MSLLNARKVAMFTGPQGPAGPQGPQGPPGLADTDAILSSPQVQGMVEYDQFTGPTTAPYQRVFSDVFSVQTLSNTPTIVTSTLEPQHSGLFDAHGIILDDLTATEFEFEITGQDSAGNVGTWKMSMGWVRHGGSPVALRAATLQSDTSGTNSGAPPGTWGVPTITTTQISGVWYAQVIVTGPVSTTIDWGMLIQWKKTL